MRHYFDSLAELWIGYLYCVPVALATLAGVMFLGTDAPVAIQSVFVGVWVVVLAVGFLAPLRDL